MKRVAILMTVCLLAMGQASAAPIDTAMAKRVALNFCIRNHVTQIVSPDLSDATKGHFEDAFRVVPSPEEFSQLLFLNSDHGYILMAADDCAMPVLGYSDEGAFSFESLPENARAWLLGYQQEIAAAVSQHATASDEVRLAWADLSEAHVEPLREVQAVSPLIQTRWSQEAYYNYYCPYDANAGSYCNYRCVTGCVATAMAQVMKYWEWPTRGYGSHSYYCNGYGTQSADFESTCYNWFDMPNSPTNVNLSISTLMYHCGVSVDMAYGTDGSVASGLDCPFALYNYFDYDASVSYVEKNNYSNANWVALMKAELDAYRPVIYGGSGANGGHCFICDGYSSSNYFHFNWGWGGQADGYFYFTSLTPGSGHDYTQNQAAVVGIQPSSYYDGYNMLMHSSVAVSSSYVNCGGTFSLTAEVSNTGSNTFTGQMAVFATLEGSNVQILGARSATLGGGYYDSYAFSSLSLSASGTYTVGVCYKASGDQYWSIPESSPDYSSRTTIVVRPTAIEDDVLETITLYPNPANDLLHITLPDNTTLKDIRLLNTMGQSVPAPCSEDNTLDISRLPAGIYFVKIITDKGIVTRKIVKREE